MREFAMPAGQGTRFGRAGPLRFSTLLMLYFPHRGAFDGG